MREFMTIVENEMLAELKGVKDYRALSGKALADLLAKNGFNPIGVGSYSHVYERGNEVVKLYFDECYDHFIKICLANPNPHFPKFKGNSVAFGSKIRMIRMEKLSLIGAGDVEIAKNVERYVSMVRNAKKNEQLGIVYEIPHEDETLVEAIRILVNNFDDSKCFMDIHGGNVMRRGDTIVIIDPFASYDGGWHEA